MDRGPVNLSTVLSRNIFSDVLYPTHSLAHSDIALASFEKYSVYMDNLIDIVFLTGKSHFNQREKEMEA